MKKQSKTNKTVANATIENVETTVVEQQTPEVVVEATVETQPVIETPAAPTAAVEVVKAAPGRPVNPNSVRQARLAAMQARAEANGGQIRLGRPVVEGSARQQRLAERQAKIEAGVPVKRGRPPFAKPTVTEVTVEAAPTTEVKVEEQVTA